jgi:hypothetical protein
MCQSNNLSGAENLGLVAKQKARNEPNFPAVIRSVGVGGADTEFDAETLSSARSLMRGEMDEFKRNGRAVEEAETSAMESGGGVAGVSLETLPVKD